MGGEMTGRKPVTRHLLCGCVLVLVGYFVTSFGLLVVKPNVPNGSFYVGNPFAMVYAVKTALGPVAGNITAILIIVIPAFGGVSNAVALNQEVYNVVISASTLVWAISTAFLFINLVKFYLQDRRAFRKLLIFPMPVLWISIVLGVTTCLISIVGTLLYSLIPNLIDNSRWWYIVGGITLACIIIAAVGSMFANSE